MSEDGYSGGQGDLQSHPPGKHRGPRFSWNTDTEAIFFASLVESVQRGLRDGTIFKPEAWENAISALNQKGAYPAKTHLINKSDNARKKFRLWRSLREDANFTYDPITRQVSAPEEVWREHIEKEPLSKSLKGRPFEHEHLYEILYADVIGTQGVALRKTKPRRKTGEMSLEPETQNTSSMMDLLGDVPLTYDTLSTSPQVAHLQYQPEPQRPMQSMHTHPQTVAVPRPAVAQMPSGQSISVVPSSPALTPPEEVPPRNTDEAATTRKRFSHAVNMPGTNGTPPHPNKRQRTAMGAYTNGTSNGSSLVFPASTTSSTSNGVVAGANGANGANGVANGANGANGVNGNAANGVNGVNGAHVNGTSKPINTLVPGNSSNLAKENAAIVAVLADAMRTKLRPSWPEQAVDIFFRDFADQELDLQLKIAEKVLCDENKAMIFVKMSADMRQHWINRLRELHNQLGR